MSGETPICFKDHCSMLFGFTNVFSIAAVTLKLVPNIYILKVHNSCLILSLKLKKVFMHQEILTIILKSQAGSNCLNVLCNMTLSSVEIIPVPLARA